VTDVLIVEDSAIAVRLVQAALLDLGASFRSAADGEAGLAEIQRQAPDLLVLDLGLPTLDGWAVLDRVRSDPQTAAMPVIVITGLGGDRLSRRAADAGADAFFSKPFSQAALLESARELLGG
jgi:CheY-like chemotaxis protein